MSPSDVPVALVTGASSGIGRAVARRLASSGHHVVATVRSPESEASVRGDGPIDVVRLDIADENALRHVISEVLSRLGRIDVLVNNAGFALVGAVEITSADSSR